MRPYALLALAAILMFTFSSCPAVSHAALPDIGVEDVFIDDAGRLSARITNCGPVEAPHGKGSLRIFVDGKAAGSYDLGSVPDREFLKPGASMIIDTGVTLGAGAHRVGAHFDPKNEIAQENEFHNTVTRTLGRPGPSAAAHGGYGAQYSGLYRYDAYFYDSKIRAAMVWRDKAGDLAYDSWPQALKELLKKHISVIETGAPSPLEGPPRLIDKTYFSKDAAMDIYAAHIAQSLWADASGAIAWKLRNMPSEWISCLLDSRAIMSYDKGRDAYFFDRAANGAVTSWNPRASYEFLENFGMVGATPADTIYKLTDWMRARLIHFTGSDLSSNTGYEGFPPVDLVIYRLPGKRHETAGCWGTTGLYASILRSVNVPVRPGFVMLSGASHSRPHFPSAGLYLAHGDDPYNVMAWPSGRTMASSELFFTESDYITLIASPATNTSSSGARPNTPGEQASFNAGKKILEAAVRSPSDHLLYLFCTDRARLEETLTGDHVGGILKTYADPYFNSNERLEILSSFERIITGTGEGSFEKGAEIVKARWLRAQNKR